MGTHNLLDELAQAEWRMADPGAGGDILVRRSGAIPLVSATAETRTLKDPDAPGILLVLYMQTDGGDITVTADTAYTQAGHTSLVFQDAGDFAILQAIESGSTNVWRLVGLDGPTGPSVEVSLDLNGQSLILDADGNTTITADTDDQIDVALGGTDTVTLFAAPAADSGTSNSIVDIAFSTPVDTTGTNNHAAITIDMAIGNATGGTNVARGIYIEGITGDAEVSEIAIQVDEGWQEGLRVEDNTPIAFGNGGDCLMDWSTADADNHALVLGLGASLAFHICELADRGTDWGLAAATNPTLYIHNVGDPTTDYLEIGGHDGTGATINLAGGTRLTFTIGGASKARVLSSGLNLANTAQHVTAAGTNIISFINGTPPTGTLANGGSLYVDTATNEELNYIDSAGNSQQLSTT